MPGRIQHHAALDLGAVGALDMRAAILVLHTLHFGKLECDTCRTGQERCQWLLHVVLWSVLKYRELKMDVLEQLHPF